MEVVGSWKKVGCTIGAMLCWNLHESLDEDACLSSIKNKDKSDDTNLSLSFWKEIDWFQKFSQIEYFSSDNCNRMKFLRSQLTKIRFICYYIFDLLDDKNPSERISLLFHLAETNNFIKTSFLVISVRKTFIFFGEFFFLEETDLGRLEASGVHPPQKPKFSDLKGGLTYHDGESGGDLQTLHGRYH